MNDAPTPPAAVDVRDLLDPELAPFLAGFELPPLDTEGLASLRGPFEMPRLSDAVVRTEHLAPGDPPVPVRVHRAAGAKAPQPAILTIHGGGYVLGSYDLDDALLDAWCPALGVVGVSVQYRLAPEHQYPGPLEDCYAALRWTHDNADRLGVDRERIGVYGVSAGGGLAAALGFHASRACRNLQNGPGSWRPGRTTRQGGRRPGRSPLAHSCGRARRRWRAARAGATGPPGTARGRSACG